MDESTNAYLKSIITAHMTLFTANVGRWSGHCSSCDNWSSWDCQDCKRAS